LHSSALSCVHPTLETTVFEGPLISSGNFTSYTPPEEVYTQLLVRASQFGNDSFMPLTNLNTLQACQWHNSSHFFHM